jgi:hypothetical protein
MRRDCSRCENQVMTAAPRQCTHANVDHVRKFVAYAKATLNKAWYYPPISGYRYIAALALYSKCITVAEAIIALLDAGFTDEAFGMTRTLVDIFISLHYIANKDTDNRAKLYCQFFAKDIAEWGKVITQYWPHQTQPLDARTLRLAANYRNPHRWSGVPVKDMALEPDTVEIDPATGKAMVHDFAYCVVFRWTSHYVHPSIVALHGHVVQAGHDNFVVHGGEAQDMSHMAAFNIASFVCNTMVCFYRCMDDPQPNRLGTWAGALVKHLARRHD